ncbi:hypothetical protein VP01_210g22 [Puccinia sorghi]|uniref:Uncharacterized protein n=1 Tax=Puccinia sorghi TaxID=27349 RepID=A0A0L6VA56_9BASI|nr:hypothetical protein VP01_210g22 [Puccinia sorghi]
MKLMGEKPLVIPKCGHRLHASCFEAVYGSLEEARRTGDVLGLCGICRKDMRLVSSGTGTFIAKTLDRNLGDHHPSQKRSKSRSQAAHTVTTANHKIHSITRKTLAPTSLDMFDDESDFEEDAQLSESELEREDELLGPWNELDPSSHQSRLLHPGGLESLRIEYKRQQSGKGRAPVKPNVTVLAENPNLFLNKDSDQSQHLTCMVTIELPSLYVAATNNSNSSQLAFQLSSPATCPSPLSPTSLPPKPSSDISPHGNPPTFPGSQLTYHPLSPPPSAVNPHPQVPPQLPTSARSPSARSVMLSPASRQQQHTEIPRDKGRQPSDRSGSVGSVKSPLTRQSSMNFIPPLPVHHDHLPPLPLNGSPSQPLQPILDDLLDRMEDWKGHSSKDFGILMKCDQIYVEKEANCRQFLVYLFEEALLCVSPVRTDSITQGWSNTTTTQHDNVRSSGCLVVGCPLKLKGRVYIRHMNSVSVIANDPNVQFLRVKMKDEKMDAFTMRFDDVNQLEDWYSTLYSLIEKQQQRDPSVVVLSPSLNSPMHLPEIDCSNTGYIPTTPLSMPPTPVASQPTGIPHVDRDLPFQIPGNSSRSSRSDSLQSSSDLRYIDVGMTTGGSTTKTSLVTSVSTLSSVGEESAEGTPGNQEFCNVFQSAQPSSSSSHCLPSSSQMNPAFRSASLRHDFRPIDLALVISIPFPEPAGSPNSSPSSVKLRLLKQSLQFLVYHLHPRSRLSLVAFTVGNSVGNARHTGQLFYTPFLCVGKATSLKRIEFAIEQISRAGRTEGILTAQNWKYFGEDIVVSQQAADSTGFGSAILQSNHPSLIQDKVQRRLRMLERREEKVSVVTAVNLAYDMILPRKQQNPLSGIMLLNDSRDCSTKPEMALVMTRAEAIQ